MKLIAAVDREWGIGCRGELLARVRADLRYFRQLTEGCTVILGSKTLATFPGGRVLGNRTNIVLSTRADFCPDGAVVVHSVGELAAILPQYDPDRTFVIGGASIYRQLLPLCDTAYITKLDKSFEKDAYLPDLDADPAWECVDIGEEQLSDAATDSEGGLRFRFCKYERKK